MIVNSRDFSNRDFDHRKLNNIDEIVFIINEAEKKRRPKPIVLMGAGASVTSGIPTANLIKDEILKLYQDKPAIKSLNDEASYYETMKCLSPMERNDLFKKYFDDSKINLTNLLLSSLLRYKKIDYVLSVNFDDLIIRASALLGFTPSFYDIANLRDFTTTNFPIGSVIYLHGFQFSSWLLNTDEEFIRVEKLLPQLFSKISNDRAWIIVGYSGQDPVFKHLCELGRFDNNLYWVCYENNHPDRKVEETLLKKEKNVYFIYGYNSDNFLLNLHYGLELQPPNVLLKPFTYLNKLYENLGDIEYVNEIRIDSQNQKVSLNFLVSNSKLMIEDAIARYEGLQSSKSLLNTTELKRKTLIYNIMECTLTNRFHLMEKEVESILKSDDNEILTISSHYYESWGNYLLECSREKSDVNFLDQAISKYEKAYQINSDNELAPINWAMALQDKARILSDLKYYYESFDLLKSFIKNKPDSVHAYFIWARGYELLSRTTMKRCDFADAVDKYSWVLKFQPNDIRSLIGYAENNSELALIDYDILFIVDSEKKFTRAYNIDKTNDSVLYAWANSLYKFGKIWKTNEYLEKSLEKFEESTFYNPRNFGAFNNWGNALLELSVRTGKSKIFFECFKKYEKCVEIRPQSTIPLTNWGNGLLEFAKIHKDISKMKEALSKYEAAYEIDNKDKENLIAYGKGLCELGILTKEKMYFIKSLEIFEEANKIDSNVSNFYLLENWGNTLYYLFLQSNDVAIVQSSIEKFEKALEIKTDKIIPYTNLVAAILELAKLKKEKKIYIDAINVLETAEKKDLKSFDMYNKWGLILYEMGIELKENNYIIESIEKYKKSIDMNKNDDTSFFNLGLSYLRLYDTTKSLNHLNDAISSFEQSITINIEHNQFEKKIMLIRSKLILAEYSKNPDIYLECFRNLEQLSTTNQENVEIFETWSNFLIRYSRIITDTNVRLSILEQAKKIATKVVELGGSYYNLACSNAKLGDEIIALAYLRKTLAEGIISVDYVLKDEDWKDYLTNEEFLKIMNEYKNSPKLNI